MRGFILAAGFGTRLRPLTDHIPKALVPLAGKPLLGHALDFLKIPEIAAIGVNTHYLPEQIEAFCATSDRSIRTFQETPEIRGTGGALQFARQFLGEGETFIVINADIVARFDLQKQIGEFEVSDDSCRLLAWSNNFGTGTIVFDQENYRYAGTAAEVTQRSGCATADFIGMALYRREFLSLLGDKDFSILPVWRKAIERGMVVSVGLIDHGYWRDIGTPSLLAKAHFDVIDGKLDIAVPPSLQIDAFRKCCYPGAWSCGQADQLGNYSWVEEPSFAPFASVGCTVVFNHAAACPQRSLHSMLLTPWGEISFDE